MKESLFMMAETQWIHCPVCGNKTRVKLRKDSVLVNFPLFCPKCKNESIIKANGLKVVIQKEK